MKPTRIGLMLDQNGSYSRGVLRGIVEYGRTKPEWVFVPSQSSIADLRVRRMQTCDAFIAHAFNRRFADALRSTGRPVVNVASVFPGLNLPRVAPDHSADGRLAAEHFLERRFQRFAFIGYRKYLFSRLRKQAFEKRLRESGYSVEWHYESNTDRQGPSVLRGFREGLKHWLRDLPYQTAVFAAIDVLGFQVTEACRELRIAVPEHVAVLGVNDDDLLCAMSRPPLSSIALPVERIGAEAAAMIDRLLEHGSKTSEDIFVAPLRVVTRQSTDIVAISDDNVSRALKFIRTNAHRPMAIADIVDHVCVSRRLLERRFRIVLGRSINAEIVRCRTDLAVQLLAESELPLHSVAVRSGFSDARHLIDTLRRTHGRTPTAIRRAGRGLPAQRSHR